MALPTDPKARKGVPIYSGCIAYFPDGLTAVAMLSFDANEQHNPGTPVHWDRSKSTDEKDAMMRHVVDPLTVGSDIYDTDGHLHATKRAWRALADLQKLIESGVPIKAQVVYTEAQEKAISVAGGRPRWWSDRFAPPAQHNPDPKADCAGCRVEAGVDVFGPVNAMPRTATELDPKWQERRCTAGLYPPQSLQRQQCILIDGHLGEHRMLAKPRICFDCGADLSEGMHSPSCLRLNRQHY